ncbi:MAG: FtsX-like permease family protein [Gemmataceae bacterium]
MSFFRLLLANLWYHKRANLAILLGVVVGTTVLTGALLFGTSLRGSLGALVLRQLGPVDLALIRSDFFQQKLAEELGAENVVPALFLQTAVGKVTKNGTQDNVGVRVPAVVLYGVDSRFWASGEDNEIGGLEKQFWDQDASDVTQEGVVLGAALAGELEVKAGDKVSLTLQKLSSAPRESILGHKDTRKVLAPITIEVKAVLPENHFGSRFSLNPNISTAKNAFVPLAVLQRQLLLTLKDKSIFPKKPINAILVCGDASPDELQKDIQDVWLSKSEDEETALAGLKDWGVHIREPNVRREGLPWDRYLRKWPYWSLESRSVFVPEVVKKAVGETDLQSAPTLVYLVNTLSSSKAEEEVPYCIVAAVDVNAKPPLGPFLGEGLEELKDDEILLTDWDQGRLGDVPKGSQVTLKYFDPNSHSQTKELTQAFTVAAHVSLPTQPKGVFFDPFLAPRVAGITDQDDPGKWDAPFPYDRSRIQTKDKQYWRNYKTTPKGIITLEAGRKLWGNRYGDTTSIRIANKQLTQEQAAHKILSKLDPQRGGFVFREIRKNALKASQNGPPIGVLFLGFSLFLIIAALLLIGLLFRLNIDKRASEMGILLGVGYRRNIVRRLLLLEGAVVALIGGIIGVGLAIWYADFSLDYLAENWPGGFDRSLLQLHINPSDLALGYLGAFLVSILTIWWSTRVLGQVVPRDLINGQLTSDEARAKDRTFFWSKLLMGVGIVGAIGCFSGGFFTQDPEVQAGSFFGSGILLLTAGLANARYLMLGRKQGSMTQGGLVGLATLGIRNAARHPTRSLLTMGLLASATFLVVAVQAFQRSPMETFSQKTGGSGGFAVLC